MKAYKGFNKDMTCRGFQFEKGKSYHEEKAELCSAGFHACEDPLDCFSHYEPGTSVFHEVELDEVSEERNEDTKIVGKSIRIGAALDTAGICRAHFGYVKSRTTYEVKADGNASAGDWGSASAGNNGSASAGAWGSASAGVYGSASAGKHGSASAGVWGSASAGNHGSASAGNNGSASAGDFGSASAGAWGGAVSRGKSEAGKCGAALARGRTVRVRGGLGAVLVAVEENSSNHEIKAWKAAIVDGEKLKADTWYTLIDGAFVEAEK